MLKFRVAFVFAVLVMERGSTSAQNMIINGSFESIGIAGYSAQIGAQPQAPSPLQTVNGWTTAGYNFLFLPGAGTVGGAKTGYNNQLTFWGSAAQNGGVSAFDFPATSPDGGNFIALDSAFSPYTLPIYQTVGGLTIGQKYQLFFYWAAAQQTGYTGATTDALQVTFGSETKSTSTYSLANHDFSGWMTQTMTFTAAAASQTLSFLGQGTPQGLPPFALLDGISMTAVPEISSSVMAVLGMSAFCFSRRRRSAREGVINPSHD